MATAREQGLAAVARLMDDEMAASFADMARSDGFTAALGAMALDFTFGSVWARGGLSAAERCLVTLAILVANRDLGVFKIYVGLAERNGLTRVEVGELLLQAIPYVGFPAVGAASAVLGDPSLAGTAQLAAAADGADSRERGVDALSHMVDPQTAQHLGKLAAQGEPFEQAFAALAIDFAYGSVWVRAGLTAAQRSLVTIAALIALRAHSELRMHFPIGLNNGLTREQIEEAMIQALPYAGFPAVVSAADLWREVLAERDKG